MPKSAWHCRAVVTRWFALYVLIQRWSEEERTSDRIKHASIDGIGDINKANKIMMML